MKRAAAIFALVFSFVLIFYFSAQTQTPAPTLTTNERHYNYGQAIRVPGVPNSAKVSERLYRGAQPRDPGIHELKKLGITTIVDLRDEEKSKIAWEQKTSEALGIHFLNIPVNGWAPPSDQQVALFLDIFREHPDEKVFVHCRFGDDRTGVFVATYRMTFERFPVGEALREMNQFG